MGRHRLITALTTGLLSISVIAAEKAAPCPPATGAFSVANAVDLENLTTAMNCSGAAVFDVTWLGFVRIREPIQVSGQKKVTVTGGLLNGTSPPAIIYAGNTTGIFNVSNHSTLTLRYLSLRAGYSEKGGAVAVTGSSALNAFDCAFAGNSATDGGAVYAEESKVRLDDNAIFSDNSAARDGGAIYASSSDVDMQGHIWFGNNSATASGGAVYAEESKVRLDDYAMFSDNSAARDGGAIYASSSDVDMQGHIWFGNNSATASGGAVYAEESKVRLDDYAMFSDNSAARDGGAIYASSSDVDMQGHIWFGNNSATASGGAVYAEESKVRLDDYAMFSDNSAARDGGAIYASSSDVDMQGHIWFGNNSATASGGAIYASDSGVRMHGDIHFGNSVSAASGGAVYALASFVYTTGDIWFGNSSSTASGGALQIEDGSELLIEGSARFEHNTAIDGGAIGGTFAAIDLRGNTSFTDNSASYRGGALHVDNGSELLVDGSARFEHNTAIDGGAIGGAFAAIDLRGNTSFTDNSASYRGGAISGTSCNLTSAGDTSFTGNSATDGGAVYVARGNRLEMIWTSTFDQNFATNRGGAMSIEEIESLDIVGAEFQKNEAVVGGAVFVTALEDHRRTFGSCSFERNKATDGGALYVATGRGIDRVDNSVFHQNYAIGSGGAIFNAGKLEALNTTFSNNMAVVDGMAVVNRGSTIVFNGVVFVGNTRHCPRGEYSYEQDVSSVEGSSNTTRFYMACSGCFVPAATEDFGSEVKVLSNRTIPVCNNLPKGVEALHSGTTLETLKVEAGYHRSSNTSHHVVKCHRRHSCLGGNAWEETCEAGHRGPYCAVCSEGYATWSTYSCRECTDRERRSEMRVAVALVVVLILAVASVLLGAMGECSKHGIDEDRDNPTLRFFGLKFRSFRQFVAKLVSLTAVKIVVGVWQIISQMAAVVEEVYPTTYASFVTKLKFVNLDIGVLLSHSCIVHISFYGRLLLSTITPFLVVSALVAMYSIAKRRNKATEAPATHDAWHSYMSAATFVTFFVYSTVSFTILQTFICDDKVDGPPLLMADYSISCDTKEYDRYWAYAVLMVWVYPIGVPAISAWWLLRNRKELANPSRPTVAHLEPLRQIWACYRPSRYYYELVEFARRTALTTAVVFFANNSLVQISVVLLLAAVFLLVSASMNPFQSTVDMNLNLWGNGVVLASMYLALLMKVNMDDEDKSFSLTAFQHVLVAANVFMVVTVLVQTAVALRDLISTAREIEMAPRRRSS